MSQPSPVTLTDRVARLIATAGGAGYSPIAPGTAGTIVAVPLAWAVRGCSLPVYLGVCVVVTVVGIWAAGRADRSWGTHDSGRIVIDEVAGYLVTVAWIDRRDLVLLVMGFFLFRWADVLKPPPARWFDRRVGGGAGVVLDDVAAGLLASLLLAAIALTDLPAQLTGR